MGLEDSWSHMASRPWPFVATTHMHGCSSTQTRQLLTGIWLCRGTGSHLPGPKGQGCLFLLGALWCPWLEAGCLLEDQLLQPLLGEIVQLHVKGERLLSHWLGGKDSKAQARHLGY